MQTEGTWLGEEREQDMKQRVDQICTQALEQSSSLVAKGCYLVNRREKFELGSMVLVRTAGE